MRRLSITRPYAKVRGVERRLKALDRWANSLREAMPAHKDERFWNYKIPVLDRLVCPPTTNMDIQGRALEAMIKAAVNLSQNSSAKELPYYRVAVLLVLPNMFHSEVTVFYDSDYYHSFLYTSELLPCAQSPSRIYNIELPDGFNECGTLVEWEDELEPGVVERYSEERWTIGQEP